METHREQIALISRTEVITAAFHSSMRKIWKWKGKVWIYVDVSRTMTMSAAREMHTYALNIPSKGPLVITADHCIQKLVCLDLLTDIPLCYTHKDKSLPLSVFLNTSEDNCSGLQHTYILLITKKLAWELRKKGKQAAHVMSRPITMSLYSFSEIKPY